MALPNDTDRQSPEERAMTDKPVTTYIVSVFEKPHWRSALTTKAKAEAMATRDALRSVNGRGVAGLHPAAIPFSKSIGAR
jgi:hypothetical protein